MGQQVATPALASSQGWLAAAGGLALATALLLFGMWRATPRRAAVPTAAAGVRDQLALGPVLAAEAALRRHPEEPEARLRLADACAGAGDPAGAALALYPVKEAAGAPVQYARCCTKVGWLDEAAAALGRLPAAPARERLELAAAEATRGETERAAALLNTLGRESLAADQWLDGAITWYHCRRLGPAVQWARRGVAAAPESPAARAVLAHCLLAAGEPEAALQSLTHPPLRSSLVDYWRARAQARCPEAARQQAGREQLARLARATGDGPAAFEAGRAFLLAGAPERAVPLLSRAVVSGYEKADGYALLSRAYLQVGRTAEALWARGRGRIYRGEYGPAAVALRHSLELNAANPAVAIDLAWALFSDGHAREALAVLQRGERAAPSNLDLRLLKARLLLHFERVPEVIQELSGAASLDRRRANEPLGNLGTIYYDSQQFDRALPVLERAVQLEPEDAHSLFYLGRLEARRFEEPGMAEAAIAHLLRAAREQPDYSRPWMEAAAVLQRLGARAEAAGCLRRAIDGDSQSDAPYVRLAQILQLEGRLPECRLVLHEYAAFRDHDLTRTRLEKETRDNPNDAAGRGALGELLLREGRPDQALPELLAATGMRPQRTLAQVRLADVSALLGYDDLCADAERAAARTAAVP